MVIVLCLRASFWRKAERKYFSNCKVAKQAKEKKNVHHIIKKTGEFWVIRCVRDSMPLLFAQRSTHGAVVLDVHRHSVTSKNCKSEQQPLDFTMSKFKSSTRHQLYRQFYGAEDSSYDKHEDRGIWLMFNFLFVCLNLHSRIYTIRRWVWEHCTPRLLNFVRKHTMIISMISS